MTLARRDLEPAMFFLARLAELQRIALELTVQTLAWLEHVRHGGDPNEMRRTHWITRDDIKAGYRKPKAIK
jgi:hypothetical protein